jgi:N-acyl-D-aspartate/D-glutamate deacylase
MSDYDILVKNGLLVDGSGAPAYRGSVAVKGDRIAAVGEVAGSAETVVDAEGLAVSPGWIDVHNHGDLTIIYYPRADGFIRQGITTFVGGQCGSGPAPFGDLVSCGMGIAELRDLPADMYENPGLQPRGFVNERHRQAYGWEIDWRTMGEFFQRLEAKGITPNYVPLVGHHQIRTVVMGYDSHRAATAAEVEEMKRHLRQAMIDGCRGFSAGRDYEPSYYAKFEELVELAKVAAEYGGVYACHSLRTGLRKARRLGEAGPVKVNGLLETLDVGRKAKIPVQVSHLGTLHDALPAGDPDFADAAAKATLKVLDDAVKEGVDAHFDLIPSGRGLGLFQSKWLAGALTPWLKVCGSRQQLGEALKMPGFREEVKATCMSGKYYGLNPNLSPGWAGMINVMEHRLPEYRKTVAAAAKEQGKDPFTALFDAISSDPDARVGSENRISPPSGWFYQHPRSMVGVDAYAIDHTWTGNTAPWVNPSENSYGGFAQYFRVAVRERKWLTLEQAVHKVTWLSASKFKLNDRGLLKAGFLADLVAFDPAAITDKATALNPVAYPEGIPHVFVNGKQVVRNSEHTGATPGRILRRE